MTGGTWGLSGAGGECETPTFYSAKGESEAATSRRRLMDLYRIGQVADALAHEVGHIPADEFGPAESAEFLRRVPPRWRDGPKDVRRLAGLRRRLKEAGLAVGPDAVKAGVALPRLQSGIDFRPRCGGGVLPDAGRRPGPFHAGREVDAGPPADSAPGANSRRQPGRVLGNRNGRVRDRPGRREPACPT